MMGVLLGLMAGVLVGVVVWALWYRAPDTDRRRAPADRRARPVGRPVSSRGDIETWERAWAIKRAQDEAAFMAARALQEVARRCTQESRR